MAGVLAVLFYIAAWGLGGAWYEGYDPIRQSISELFARGAPRGPADVLSASLILVGVVLPPFAVAMHRVLPGRSPVGPVLAASSGVLTALVAAFPCTRGCPGLGASLTDTMHVGLAAVGYATFIAAPLALVPRLRGRLDGLARASLVLGGVAAVGFVLRQVGFASDLAGLQQRIYNTAADAWYVLVAVVMYRRAGSAGADGSEVAGT